MSVTNAINNLKSNVPSSEAAAAAFLSNLPQGVQEQLISAVYIGREHIHSDKLRDDMEISRAYTDHISKDDYARIIYEKGENIPAYLEKLEQCANASGFDLNSL